MPIELTCTGCSRELRVADEHAGKSARCPQCQTIVAVPLPDQRPTFDIQTNEPSPSWYMKTPEGQVYGPVNRADLDRWFAEGRVASDCMLRQDPSSTWMNAEAVFPLVNANRFSETARPAPSANPTNPFAAPTSLDTSHSASRFQAPHRGGLILTLGLISWVIGCPIFGIIAWIMGTSDLREMRAGRMDRSGQGLTQAGQILGAIHSVLLLLGLAFFFFMFFIAIVSS